MTPSRHAQLALLFATLLLFPGAIGAQRPQSEFEGEPVQVSLTTVPFYAVDDEGNPVYDLSREEITLSLDGETRPFDTLDRYAFSHPSPAGGPESVPRHVFLLFDLVFSRPAQLQQARTLGAGLVDSLPAEDQIYLLVNHSDRGLEQVLGPVGADPRERQALRQTILDLKPNIERLRPSGTGGLPPPVDGKRRFGIPGSQLGWRYRSMQATGEAEERSEAVELAAGLETLAAALHQLQEPKMLLMFSGGISGRRYFSGNDGLGVGSSPTQMYHVSSRFSGPILFDFEQPLAALAASGVMPIFVNTSGHALPGRSSLHHMSEATGGLYIENLTGKELRRKVKQSTSAYYEVGFYLENALPDARPPQVKLATTRPGVRVWTPERLQTRRLFSQLTERQREFLVLDLVHRGVDGWQEGGPQRTRFYDLPSRVAGRDTPQGERELLLRVDWPEGLHGRELDLYDVVLEVRHSDESADLVRLDRQPRIADGQPLILKTALPRDRAVIWGVVAVDPVREEAHFRRLLLQSPQVSGGGARATAGRNEDPSRR